MKVLFSFPHLVPFVILGLLFLCVFLCTPQKKGSVVSTSSSGNKDIHDEFITYLCSAATKAHVSKAESDTRQYFIENFDELKYFYAEKTRKGLVIHERRFVIKKAVREYLKN